MRDVVVHLTVRDEDWEALEASLMDMVDEGEFTHVSFDMPEPGAGGTYTRHPARVDSFGEDGP